MPTRMSKNWIPWGSCNNPIISADQLPSSHCKNFPPFNKVPGIDSLTVPLAFSVSAAQDQTWNAKKDQFTVSLLLAVSTKSLLCDHREGFAQHKLPKWPFLCYCYLKANVRWDVHTGLFLCFCHIIHHLYTEAPRHRKLNATVWWHLILPIVCLICILYQVPYEATQMILNLIFFHWQAQAGPLSQTNG